MKKRSVLLIAFLSFITFGIFTALWLYWSQKELKGLGFKLPSYWRGSAPVVMVLSSLVLQIIYNLATPENFPLHDTGGGISLPSGFAAFGFLLAIFVGLPLALPWLYKYCQAVERVTAGKYPASLSFVMAVGLQLFNFGFIWPALMQYEFNKLATGQTKVSTAGAPRRR